MTLRTTSQGEVELPIRYHDATAVIAFFAAERDRVERALDCAELVPGLAVGPRRVVVGMAFYNYRVTSIGPYLEVGVAVPVFPLGGESRLPLAHLARDPTRRRLGFRVLDLPVTTEIANAGGRELWGLPKFVTPISLSLGGGRLEGTVHDPDGGPPLVSLSGRLPLGVPSPPLSLLLYSEVGGQHLRTAVRVQGWGRLGSGRRLALEISEGGHPMARRLRDLGLQGARPLLVTWTDAFRSVLEEGHLDAVRGARPTTGRHPLGT